MKRIATLLTLLTALAAMSKTPAYEPLPEACAVLEAVNMAATLGADAAYVAGPSTANETVRMSLCTAETPDLSVRMGLMVRENLVADAPSAEVLREASKQALRDTIGAEAVIEDVALGDAAMWVGEIGQLTVWHRGGRVMLIFSPTPPQDLAAAKAAAEKVLAAFP